MLFLSILAIFLLRAILVFNIQLATIKQDPLEFDSSMFAFLYQIFSLNKWTRKQMFPDIF